MNSVMMSKEWKYFGLLLVLILIMIGCHTSLTPTVLDYPILFEKHPEPVWEGAWLAGDPSVIQDGDRLLMYYTDLDADIDTVDWDDPESYGVVIGVAESQDGINWVFAKEEPSIALSNNPEGDDKVLETAFVTKIGESFCMYYTGYPEGADGAEVIVSDGHIYLASSENGITFERQSSHLAVLGPGETYDVDGVFSPSIVFHEGKHYMIYAGWSLQLYGYGLFGAVSEDDGLTWQKDGKLLIRDSDVPWALDNPREAELVKGPDGIFYLFFTSDMAHNLSGIGLARSSNPFGPWEVYPDPVIFKTHSWEESGLIAPAVLIDDGKFRVWYMSEQDNFSKFYIGYAELGYPLEW